MKRIKLAKGILMFNFIYWIIYNTVFGWNMHPINQTEENFDIVFKIILYLGLIIYLSPLADLYEEKVKKLKH